LRASQTFWRGAGMLYSPVISMTDISSLQTLED
ncbi:MAG: hypothetical protein ACI9MU_002952, partial [Alphaproteobacteria bacterium]